MGSDQHEYRTCTDEHCERFPCKVYQEGYADGFQVGHAQGYGEGHADGYGEGFDAGYLAATAGAG